MFLKNEKKKLWLQSHVIIPNTGRNQSSPTIVKLLPHPIWITSTRSFVKVYQIVMSHSKLKVVATCSALLISAHSQCAAVCCAASTPLFPLLSCFLYDVESGVRCPRVSLNTSCKYRVKAWSSSMNTQLHHHQQQQQRCSSVWVLQYCLIFEKNLLLKMKSGKCGQAAMAIKYKAWKTTIIDIDLLEIW